MKALVTATALLFSSLAMAQTPCESFQDAIDDSLKAIAAVHAAGHYPNSAAGESARNSEIANELQLISIHVALMGQNKCQPLKTKISQLPYSKAALACSSEMGRDLQTAVTKPVCDRKTWQRSQ